MKKLSDRAKVLLLIVDSKTKFDADGKIAAYFVPGSVSSIFYCDHLRQATSISGGSDARALKSLERAGLVARPPNTPFVSNYCYVTTETGRAEVAKILESDWSYLRKNVAQD